MAASPHLSQKVRDALGDEAGDELIDILDKAASDIAEVRGDIAELQHQMEIGFEKTGKVIEHELRKQTQFFFLAWAVLLATMVGQWML